MFDFKKTKMLQAAQASPTAPSSFWIYLSIFLLVFLASSLGQSLIVLPLQFLAIQCSLPYVWVTVAHLFSTAITILVCIFYCIKFEKRNFQSLGLARAGGGLEYLAGLGIGFVMLALPAMLCVAMGQATLQPAGEFSQLPWGMILLFFAAFLVQGMSEEILCRSFLLVSLSRGHKPWVCILTNSLLFAALHIFNQGITPLALLNLTLFGIFASIYMLRRGSVWGIAAIHSMWNFTQGNIFGVAVSGMTNSPTLWCWTYHPQTWWLNGGTFGLEGGLAVTGVLVVGIVVILATKTKSSEVVK